MKIFLTLAFCCALLTACQSDQKTDQAGSSSEPATLKHLQQDDVPPSEISADAPAIWLIPQPLTAAEPAVAVVNKCQNNSTYDWFVNGELIESEKERKLSNEFFLRGDEVSVSTDCAGGVADVSVRVDNTPPTVKSVKFTEPTIIAGQDLTLAPEGEDIDGDELEFFYQWLIDDEPVEELTEASLPGDYVKRGTRIAVEVTPYDGFSEGPIFTSRSFEIPNSAPQITSTPPAISGTENYSYQVEAYDPDGDPLSFQLGEAPEGMNISSEGLISWPINHGMTGEYMVNIVVADTEELQSTQSFTIILNSQE